MLIILLGCGIIPELSPKPDEIIYRALLVGVGDYLHFSFPVDLQSPPYNVDRVREVLENCIFDFEVINELKDLNATKEAILAGIISTFVGADDNDISYFYWNGHGGARIEPHINPTDTQHTPETWISIDELEAVLDPIKGTKIIIFDTCFSGNFIEKGYDFSKAFNKDRYYVLTSCKGNQTCKEFSYADPPYGIFTMGFYEGCMAGVMALKDLRDYIRDWVKENHPNCNQTAQCWPDDSDFQIIGY